MLYVLLFNLASDEDVVDTAEVEDTQNTNHEAQEGLGGIPQAKRHSKKANEPNGLVIAVFGMSSGFAGI